MDLDIKATQSKERIKVSNVKGFSYDDVSHCYLMDGIKLKSATTYIKEFVPEFNSHIISNMVANKNEKNGRKYLTNPQLVAKYWAMQGKHSSGLGTAGHDFCVMYWLDPENTRPVTVLDMNAKKLMDDILSKFEIVRMEIPKGSAKYKIGYTVDLLMKGLKDGLYYLGDFKFSKAFTSEQYKEDKGRLPNKMKDLLQDFRDVGHDKGVIQLNMYKEFLREEGINVSKSFLFHIDGLSSYYGDKGYKAYPVQDLPELTEELLKSQIDINVIDLSIDKEVFDKI